MANENPQLIHKKQSLYPWQTQSLQLAHCLDNLFQQKNVFTEVDLDAISDRVRRNVPGHVQAGRSLLQYIFKPNYNIVFRWTDYTVALSALREKVGRDPYRIDHGKKLLINDFDPSFEHLIGIVLNVVAKKFFWKVRHWVALRKIDGVWYKFDSDHSSPIPFINTSAVHSYLVSVHSKSGEIILVRNIQEAF